MRKLFLILVILSACATRVYAETTVYGGGYTLGTGLSATSGSVISADNTALNNATNNLDTKVTALVSATNYFNSGFSLLGTLSANMNSTADQQITVPTNCVIRQVMVYGVSTSLTLAAGGIYSEASKGGIIVIPAAQLYSGLTGYTNFLDLTLNAVATLSVITNNKVYLSLTTAQGGAATAKVALYGNRLP